MDASDSTLVKRYRKAGGCIRCAHRRTARLSTASQGTEILTEMKKKADYIIDTSKLLTRELKEEIDRIFCKEW